MDTEEYRKKIEKEILDIIEERLKAREMNAARAREVASYILASLQPHMTLDQINTVAQNFDDHFPELIPVVLQITNDYDNIVKKTVQEHVASLIKQNKIDEANTLLKQAIKKKSEIISINYYGR